MTVTMQTATMSGKLKMNFTQLSYNKVMCTRKRDPASWGRR